MPDLSRLDSSATSTSGPPPAAAAAARGPRGQPLLGSQDFPVDVDKDSMDPVDPSTAKLGLPKEGAVDLTNSFEGPTKPTKTSRPNDEIISISSGESNSTPVNHPSSSSAIDSKPLATTTTTTTTTKPKEEIITAASSAPKSSGEPRVPLYSEMLDEGTRCAVFKVPQKGSRDHFGFLETKMWVPGIVFQRKWIPNKSREQTNKLQVILDTGSQSTVVWTWDKSSKVQRLIKEEDGSERLEMSQSVCRSSGPTDLRIGDAVLSWFQKGQGTNEYDCFCGRVAAVEGDHCSVAYTDGDWEENIPFKEKEPHVVLTRLSKGWDEPTWMEGMKLKTLSSKKTGGPCPAIVTRCEPRGSIWVKFDNQTKEEKFSYHSVASCIMREAKQHARNYFSWPVPNVSSVSNDSSSSPMLDVSFESATMSLDSPFSSLKKPTREHPNRKRKQAIPSPFANLKKPTRKHPNTNHRPQQSRNQTVKLDESEGHSDSKDDSTGSLPDAYPATNIRPARKTAPRGEIGSQKSSRGRSKKSSEVDFTSKSSEETCVPEPVVGTAFKWEWPSSYMSMEPIESEKEASIMGPAALVNFASTLERTWNSCESEIAAAITSHVQVHDGVKPASQLQKAMNKLLLKGPQTGQSNPLSFPDCQRMDLADEVVQEVNFSWFTFWEQMASDLYCVKGDNRRTNKFAIQRLATTAHAKAITVKRFLENARKSFPNTPLVWLTEIRQHPSGVRVAFQDAVHTFVSLWMSYGHFYLNPKWEMDDISFDLKDFIQHNSRKLQQNLAKVLSFAAQVYAVEEEQTPEALSHFLAGRIEAMLQDFSPPTEFVYPVPLDEYERKMKLRMILDLDSIVLPGVRPLLAARMGLASEYNLIFD